MPTVTAAARLASRPRRAGDHRDPGAVDRGTAYFDSHGPDVASGVGRGQHRQPGREAVATCAGNPGADPRDARKDSVQQERVGQRGPVAILRTDRLGEPVQLAAAAARPFDPGPVVPTDGCVTEGVVVLHRARRPGSAMRGDVDLLGHVQLAPQVIGEQSRQSRAHRRADDQRGAVAPGVIVEVDEGCTSAMSADMETTDTPAAR